MLKQVVGLSLRALDHFFQSVNRHNMVPVINRLGHDEAAYLLHIVPGKTCDYTQRKEKANQGEQSVAPKSFQPVEQRTGVRAGQI